MYFFVQVFWFKSGFIWLVGGERWHFWNANRITSQVEEKTANGGQTWQIFYWSLRSVAMETHVLTVQGGCLWKRAPGYIVVLRIIFDDGLPHIYAHSEMIHQTDFTGIHFPWIFNSCTFKLSFEFLAFPVDFTYFARVAKQPNKAKVEFSISTGRM